MPSSNPPIRQDLPEPSPRDLQAAAQGDREAFRRIVERYEGMVYTMAYNLLGNSRRCRGRGAGGVLAAAPEAQRLPRPLVVHDVALPPVDERDHRLSAALAPARRPSPTCPSRSPTPRRRCCGAIGYEGSSRLSAELPPDYRLPLVLRDIYGLTYAEISDAVDRPLGTVKASVHRGRNSLRLRLRASGAFDAEG